MRRLAEPDVRRARSGDVHQAVEIAYALSMDMQCHPAFRLQDEAYGDAILTASESELTRAHRLPVLVELRIGAASGQDGG